MQKTDTMVFQMFENKIDHTTYFGDVVAYVEGIHMIPLLPHSRLTRSQQFVQEEWDTYFSDLPTNQSVAIGGWRGIIYANLALIDPKSSYMYFANMTNDTYSDEVLDGGASRTWYLAWAAGLGGADDLYD